MPSAVLPDRDDARDLIVVTGGLSGIGAAAAKLLAADGKRIIVLDRATPTTAAVPPGVESYPDQIDISDEAAVAGACTAIEDQSGPIAGLVNAAGILGKMHPPHHLSLGDWDREVAVDLRGTFIMCREIGTRMCKRRQGAIVNVASVVGVLSAPVHGYGPAKAAVINLTAALAAEWGPFGIRVNCVSPGFTNTAALRKGLDADVLDLENLKRVTPLGRLVEPEEVASAIVWLLSPHASGVTGINLSVDAGFLAGVSWQAYGGFREIN